MGLRFRKSVKLGKNSRINIGKKSLGLSVGRKGLRFGIGSKGPYTSVGIPGTGISNLSYLGGSTRKGGKRTALSDTGNIGTKYPSASNVSPGIGCVIFFFIFIIICVAIALPKNSYAILVTIAVSIILTVFYYHSPGSKIRRRLGNIRTLYRQNKFAETIAAAQEFLIDNPDDQQVLYLLGLSLFKAEKYDEAIKYLRDFIGESPNFNNEKFFLAKCYRMTKNYSEAINILQQIPDTFENMIKVIILQAECFQAMGKRDLAIEVLKHGPLQKRKLDEDLLELHYLLGVTYEEMGESIKALKHFNKVLSCELNYKDANDRVMKIGKSNSQK